MRERGSEGGRERESERERNRKIGNDNTLKDQRGFIKDKTDNANREYAAQEYTKGDSRANHKYKHTSYAHANKDTKTAQSVKL